MISFEKVTPVEFKKYASVFITEYSQELIENYGYSDKYSVAQAQRELDDCFPNGEATANNHLVAIKLSENQGAAVVGYLWYTTAEQSDHAFICDFFIRENRRSQGYGKAAIDKLEGLLLASGIKQLRLRVAYTNSRALKLYEAIGFQVTGLNMMKKL